MLVMISSFLLLEESLQHRVFTIRCIKETQEETYASLSMTNKTILIFETF